MKLKQLKKKKSPLEIIIAVVSLLIICIVLTTFGFLYENENYETEEVSESMTLETLNETINIELDQMKIRGGLITRISELQSKQLRGWKVIVLPDIDYLDEMKTAEAEVIELGKDHPELKIVGSSMVSGDKEIEIWVSGSSPENEALEGKVIHGWTIHIYVCSTPPPTEQV